ncbi:MAG: tRNA lysidine(34) synthetase [Bacteroidota bacterium]
MEHNSSRADEKLFTKLARKCGVTLRDHEMIGEGDHVLAGLSGGKDSMILLKILAERRRAMPFSFRLTAAHILVPAAGYVTDTGYLEDFCRDLDIPLIIRETEVDLERDPNKTPCFVCSWHRRKLLFDLTRELNCNKLALGHHREDALETYLMNMMFHGSISSLPYTLKMFEGRVTLIRPLLDISEALLGEYSELSGLVRPLKNCPHENNTRRMQVRRILKNMEEIYPQSTHNLFRSADHIYDEYLPLKKGRNKTP